MDAGLVDRLKADSESGRECTFVPLKIRWCKECVNFVRNEEKNGHIDLARGKHCEQLPSERVVLMVFNHYHRRQVGIFDPLCHKNVFIGGRILPAMSLTVYRPVLSGEDTTHTRYNDYFEIEGSFDGMLCYLKLETIDPMFENYRTLGLARYLPLTEQLQEEVFEDGDRSLEMSAALSHLVMECAVYMGTGDIWDIGERLSRVILEHRKNWRAIRQRIQQWYSGKSPLKRTADRDDQTRGATKRRAVPSLG